MQIRNLGDTPFQQIMECFFEAFQNYFVEMPKDTNYFKERWRMANVNYNLSYGIFDQDKLVGFFLSAIDVRDGLLTCYNAATGVLPNYRGKKLVKSMYDHAIPILKANGIERCTLEVITDNHRAIKAYENVGFKIIKTYLCFNGTLNPKPMDAFELRERKLTSDLLTRHLNQHWYSWENHALTIIKGNFKYYEIIFQDEAESYFVIAPKGGYVAQLEVLQSNPNVWDRLLYGLSQISEKIKINNVDDKLPEKIFQLSDAGLNNHISQFEMEMTL